MIWPLKTNHQTVTSALRPVLQVQLEIQRNTDCDAVPGDEQFELWVGRALAGKSGPAEVVIRVVDSEEAREFNHRYRGKDYATNVLSFPAELPQGIPPEMAGFSLGDLLICAPVVKQEAQLQQKCEQDHWAHLTIHGVLHLLGYDHQIETDAVEMEALETKILSELGVSNPYLDY